MSGTESAPDGGFRPDPVLHNAGYSLATQFLTAAFTAGLTVFLARQLGAAGYGVFALATGVSALAIQPLDLGISASASRFLAEGRGDAAKLRSVLCSALRLKLGVTVSAAAALAILSRPIAAAYRTPALVWPLRGVALCVLGESLVLFYLGTFSALGRMRLQLRMQWVESTFETTASVLFVLLGGGAAGAAFGRAIGYLVGSAFGIYLSVQLLGRDVLPWRSQGTGHARLIAGYAGPLAIVNGAFTLFTVVDILIIGIIRNASAVGLFQAPLRLTSFLAYPGLSVAGAVAPRVVGDDPDVVRARFQSALRGTVLLGAVAVTPMIVWARPLVELGLGKGYAASAVVLAALAPFAFLSMAAPLVSLSLNYLGQARRRVVVALGTVALNAVIDLALVPHIGVLGGVIGTDIAFAVYTPVHLTLCRRELGLELRPLLITVLRSVVAAAAACGLLATFGTRHVSVVAMLIGGVVGFAAYGAVLLLLGEVTQEDLSAALREGRRLVRKVRR